jgi:hypothetical protein
MTMKSCKSSHSKKRDIELNKNVLIFLLAKVNPTFWTVAKTVLTLDSVKNVVDDADADAVDADVDDDDDDNDEEL